MMKRLLPDDVDQIRQAASLCMYLVDSKQWSRLNEVFTEDAVYDGSATRIATIAEGLPAIAKLWASLQQGVHYSTDLIVLEAGEDGASARVASKWMSVQESGKVNTGDYNDRWIKAPGGWRVKHRINTLRKPDPGTH